MGMFKNLNEDILNRYRTSMLSQASPNLQVNPNSQDSPNPTMPNLVDTTPPNIPQDHEFIDQYKQALLNAPKVSDYHPSIARRIAGAVVGLGYGPKAASDLVMSPYQRQLMDYERQTGNLGLGANLESGQRAAAYKAYLEQMQAEEARQHGKLFEYQQSPDYMHSRFGYQPQSLQELQDITKLQHPGNWDEVTKDIKQADGTTHTILTTIAPDGTQKSTDLGVSGTINPQDLESARQQNRIELERMRESGRVSLEKQRESARTSTRFMNPSQQQIAVDLAAREYLRQHPDLQDKIQYNQQLQRFEPLGASEFMHPSTWFSNYSDQADEANKLLKTYTGSLGAPTIETTKSESKSTSIPGFEGFAKPITKTKTKVGVTTSKYKRVKP
jgi:hypothetical protein